MSEYLSILNVISCFISYTEQIAQGKVFGFKITNRYIVQRLRRRNSYFSVLSVRFFIILKKRKKERKKEVKKERMKDRKRANERTNKKKTKERMRERINA